jgi:hypothetical protein
MRYFRLGLSGAGHDIKLQSELLPFLTVCEALVGNLGGAKRLAGQIAQSQFSNVDCVLRDGEWRAAGEALEEALNLARNIGAKWDELNGLPCGRIYDARPMTMSAPARLKNSS